MAKKKDVYWFKHECGASRDLKMMRIKAIHGHAGVGIFWQLIEVLREQNNYVWENDETSIQMLGKIIDVDPPKFATFIRDCKNIGLLTFKGKYLFSEKLCSVMQEWETKKKSSAKGGEKNKSRIRAEKGAEVIAEPIAGSIAEVGAEPIANKRREEKRREEDRREEKKREEEIIPASPVLEFENSGVVKKRIEGLHAKMIEAYLDFCEFTLNIPRPPMILNKEKELPALKRIREYLLHAVQGDEDRALSAFKFILGAWRRLDIFLQKQTTLIQISSNLQNIIAQLKNENATGKTGATKSEIISNHNQDQLRRVLEGDL